ncbi:MAG: FAD-dependent oxidoreductase, partial [Actinobacteria bacterium]
MTDRPRYDAAVIGAGHNGLVTAAYLARGGYRVLVLERRDKVGGILADIVLGPGLKAPALTQTVGRLRPSVIRDLRLAAHGLELIRPVVRLFAPQPDGDGVTLWADPRRTADGLRSLSEHDAAAFPAFDRRVRTIASFLAYLDA